MKRTSAAVAVVEASPTPATPDPVEALRSRLAGSTAREHVVLDFLEDDLREARAALAAVAAWIANVEAALSDGEPSQLRLLSLALGGRPGDRIEELATAVASVRRRLAQVAARM
ncbi:MAG TPA: hypothetical protein VF841_20770 [Anaeromyxobacter sp.]